MAIRIDGTNTTANPGITGADTDTGLQFGTNEIQLVTGGTNRATVESNGNLTIEDGNLVVASGHGIDFSATVNASGSTTELFDDYEEGTWTPVFAGATTSGTYTYTLQTGLYTKIGNTVIVHCALTDITTVSAGSGPVRIQGLPYTTHTATAFPHGTPRLSQFNIAADAIDVNATAVNASTQVAVVITRDNLAASSVQVTGKVNNTAYIYFSLAYRVD